MSQELLAALNQEAISRMSPYELVERAVSLREESNALQMEPVELEDGGTLYAVTSGMVSDNGIRTVTVVEGGELVRRQVMHAPLTAFADIVELRPPAKRSDDGEARLYRVSETLTPGLAEARLPFRDTAVSLVRDPEPGHGSSPIRFNGVTNDFYRVLPGDKQAAGTLLYHGSGRHKVLAKEQTELHITEVGRDELDHEVGVLVAVSGLVRAVLDERQFARITSSGVAYGPGEEKVLDINVPVGTPQGHSRKFYRIPDDATIGPNEEGVLVPQGERAKDRKYEYTELNPGIDPASLLNLLPEGTIDWTDGTKAFIESFSGRIARLMPLDAAGVYRQTRDAAVEAIQRSLLTHRKPLIGGVGCLAVAARIAELPTEPEGRFVVNDEYFARAV